ncbi:MAG: GTPase Era [Muribaculaceae bacterium]|nr:GTPase Era [Muribaculaceae bacterium]
MDTTNISSSLTPADSKELPTAPLHKSGFVNIVGNPNVGKSTLMNDLVGERISIITSKAQTTRHRIMGIVNTPEYQIVFSDTPGVLKPKYKMQEGMLAFSEGALTDADVLIYVTDVVEDPEKNADFLAKVAKEKIPVLLVINKIDLLKGNGDLDGIVAKWRERLPQAEIFPTSAKEHFNVDNLMKRIVELLPAGEPYFGKDALTDKPARFFVTEIIREKILLDYDKEIPYSTEAIVEKFEEKDNSIHIMAVIYVERDSQKGILIGKGGSMLKKVGIQARQDIEKFFGKKVYLEMFVKVEDNWRNREAKLRQFGYIE